MSNETIPSIENDRDSSYRCASGRNISALLNPRPLAIIGASNGNSTGFATVAWITPLSHDPSMVAISLRAGSHTCGLLREAGCFSINVADTVLLDAVRYCGSTSGHHIDKSSQVKHHLAAHTPLAAAPNKSGESTVEGNTDPQQNTPQEPSPVVQSQADDTRSVRESSPVVQSQADGARSVQKASPDEQPPACEHHANNACIPFVEGALSFLDCEVESIQEKGDHLLICAYVTEAITQCPEDNRGRIISPDTLLCVQSDLFATASPGPLTTPSPL